MLTWPTVFISSFLYVSILLYCKCMKLSVLESDHAFGNIYLTLCTKICLLSFSEFMSLQILHLLNTFEQLSYFCMTFTCFHIMNNKILTSKIFITLVTIIIWFSLTSVSVLKFPVYKQILSHNYHTWEFSYYSLLI